MEHNLKAFEPDSIDIDPKSQISSIFDGLVILGEHTSSCTSVVLALGSMGVDMWEAKESGLPTDMTDSLILLAGSFAFGLASEGLRIVKERRLNPAQLARHS